MKKIIYIYFLIISGFSYANPYIDYDDSYQPSEPYESAEDEQEEQYESTQKRYDPRYMYNYRTGESDNYTYNYNVRDREIQTSMVIVI